MRQSALAGVRILDFTWALAGPHATLLLALLGAQVIKVETRKRIDLGRRLYPLGPGPNKSPAFSEENLNKLSVTLDLTHPKALELAKRLVGISDAVVENFSPGTMNRFGLGYDLLRQIKPDIVMVSSSAAGATGPERDHRGYAAMFNSLSGLGHITGYPDMPPTEIRTGIDLRVGTTIAFAVLAGLCYRQRTGKGQHIDLSSREAIICFTGEVLLDYIMNQRVQCRQGNRDHIMAPHNCYRCRGEDSWVSIAVRDEEWPAFCAAIGNPQWAEDEKFSDALSRWKNQEELDSLVEQWTMNYFSGEVAEILQGAGIAAVPSYSAEGLFNDAHLKQRGVFLQVDHAELGRRYVLGPPWKLSETSAMVTTAAPLLAEHNPYVLGELLGLSPGELAELDGKGVLW